MKRFHQVLLIATFLPLCWLAMQAVHEFGHVLGAWLSGGQVSQVVLHPLAISRTDVSPNPHPLLVVWAGPLVGVLLPLLMYVASKLARWPTTPFARFFAGFCLIANGAYIGLGSFGRIGDAGEMLTKGSPAWWLWLFGIVTMPLGLWLWNDLGKHFGLAEAHGVVDRRAAYASASLLIAMIVVECALSATN